LIGDDTNEVDLHFINKVNSRVNVSWVQKGGSDHGKHILMGEMNGVGDKVNLNSFHGHEFVFKDRSEDGHGHGRLLHKVAVDNDQGGR
jgi:hypothetical protein